VLVTLDSNPASGHEPCDKPRRVLLPSRTRIRKREHEDRARSAIYRRKSAKAAELKLTRRQCNRRYSAILGRRGRARPTGTCSTDVSVARARGRPNRRNNVSVSQHRSSSMKRSIFQEIDDK